MSKPTSSADLLPAAQAILPDLVELRRRLHRRPEQGLHLPETQAAVAAWGGAQRERVLLTGRAASESGERELAGPVRDGPRDGRQVDLGDRPCT